MMVQAMASRFPRIAIVGGPRTGKSTLARVVRGRPVISTDDYMELPWEEVPAAVIDAATGAGASFVVEGVQVARALRRGLEVDAVVVLTQPKVAQTDGQIAMGKGVHTVFDEWRAANPRAVVMRETR